jgi:hypothetical protein
MSAIAPPISSLLFDLDAIWSSSAALPPWLSGAVVAQRMQVWVAVGVLIEHGSVGNEVALAALRAYAVAHGLSIDDIAARLTDHELQPEAVLRTLARA